jgi:hypothetical protein
VFIRAIEAPIDEKAAVLRAAARRLNTTRFEVDQRTFAQVPRSPFAYWTGDAIRACFAEYPRFEAEGRVARQGLATADDFRFVRLASEVLVQNHGARWIPFAKGGAFSRFYADVYLVVDWADGGRNVDGYAKSFVRNPDFFFRAGLTWPLRTQGGLSFRVLPSGCIFSHKGPAAFVNGDDPSQLLALAAIANSRAFAVLVEMQMAFGSYEVGVIQLTPVPSLAVEAASPIAALAHQSYSLKRRLDTRTEDSHAFLLPALLQAGGGSFADRAQRWAQFAATTQAQLDVLAAEIDEHAFRLYGISAEDRQRIEQGFGTSGEAGADDDGDDDDQDVTVAEVDAAPMVASLLSWSLGVAFGRFDVRLATGEREAPPEPEPFDALPLCSPGTLTGDECLPVAAPPQGYPLTFPSEGILVDDPGHQCDVVRAFRSVFRTVFDDANARWHEAAELLGTTDLRTWFARDFFEPHIKRYSKSRRKAPVYWQLATASGSYSVWLYIHRATGDTLFRVLNDFVGPKLDHEKAKLDRITREVGGNPSAAQRREIEQQETFVGELQALKTEVARLAPLWKPDLDDGVILNFAPLWRLVPQSRSWQSECKKAWDKLVAGDFDWAHIAMHLWPERVVPKCIDDRSLAIAHGLEDVFWHEDDSGTWRKSRVDDVTIQRLIRERTSSTVKAALKDLLSGATPVASKGRKTKGRSASSRTNAPKPAPAAARTTNSETSVDEATLRAVEAAIASVADGASKADVLAATGLTDGDWNKAIAALLNRGNVTRTGQKRGTRYHADSPGEGG